LEWAALAAPNRSSNDAEEFAGRLRAATEVTTTGEELLARMDAEMPEENDVASLTVDALNAAAKYGHLAVASSLLELGTSPDGRVTRTNKANSPLMIAALHDHADVAELLLRNGAGVNLTNSAQATAAHIAAASSTAVLEHLLRCGGVRHPPGFASSVALTGSAPHPGSTADYCAVDDLWLCTEHGH